MKAVYRIPLRDSFLANGSQELPFRPVEKGPADCSDGGATADRGEHQSCPGETDFRAEVDKTPEQAMIQCRSLVAWNRRKSALHSIARRPAGSAEMPKPCGVGKAAISIGDGHPVRADGRNRWRIPDLRHDLTMPQFGVG
jgi:hypothetical protein